jgi:SAM-dependent methyltransferase
MVHNNKEVLEYWERDEVESMYDKHVLAAEIALIIRRLKPGAKILDAGCGEGEGTLKYASIPGTTVHGADFSKTRLLKAKSRLSAMKNVSFRHVDFLQEELPLDEDYDFIVSQRFLINLMEWELQQKVLRKLIGVTKPGGRLIILEGSVQGVDELNSFRSIWGLPPIPVKWHNLFFDDNSLINFMNSCGCKFVESDGLGSYFLLTRGIRPIFDKELNWDSEFNRISSSGELGNFLDMGARFSRLKLFVFDVNKI